MGNTRAFDHFFHSLILMAARAAERSQINLQLVIEDLSESRKTPLQLIRYSGAWVPTSGVL